MGIASFAYACLTWHPGSQPLEGKKEKGIGSGWSLRTREASKTNYLNLKLRTGFPTFTFGVCCPVERVEGKGGTGVDCPHFSELVTFSSQGITAL